VPWADASALVTSLVWGIMDECLLLPLGSHTLFDFGKIELSKAHLSPSFITLT